MKGLHGNFVRHRWGTTPTMPGLSRLTSSNRTLSSAPRADRRTPLTRTLTRYSEAGQPRPRTGQAAHMRNRGFTCGTRWSPSRCCARPIRICTCCRWVHDPIGWHCTPSDWVRCPLTGAVLLALLLRYLLSRCPGAAARPRDRHTRACGSEWSISKPGQALPPPPGIVVGLLAGGLSACSDAAVASLLG